MKLNSLILAAVAAMFVEGAYAQTVVDERECEHARQGVATVGTPLVTIVALAQYHDALAEHASVGIILADERLKEYVVCHKLEP
jgi:hypothetical protein